VSAPSPLALALDDEQERRSTLLLPHEGSSLGGLAPRGAGWRLTKRGSGPTTSEPLLRAFYPSLPEPRRRIDLALWAVVVEVGMAP
jgi:hypothetical protein